MQFAIETITGFVTLVVGYLTKYKTQITAGDYDPTVDIEELPEAAEAVTLANQTQESNKSGQKLKTQDVKRIFRDSYESANGALDMAVGIIGKTTVEGKEGLELRARLGEHPTADPADLIGFINSVSAYLGKYQARVEPKIAVASRKTKLAAAAQAVSDAEAAQEGAKTTRGTSTVNVNTLAAALYTRASGCLDAAVGAVGKNTIIGKEGLEIRARLKREQGGGEPTPPAPPPAPPTPPAA